MQHEPHPQELRNTAKRPPQQRKTTPGGVDTPCDRDSSVELSMGIYFFSCGFCRRLKGEYCLYINRKIDYYLDSLQYILSYVPRQGKSWEATLQFVAKKIT
ncbi:hypothetical protein V2J09_024004 [Rumex salicifolius]